MTTTVESPPQRSSPTTRSRLPGVSLIVAGIAFFVGGVTHPTDSGEGNKVEQLHEMLVDSSWYPSHAALLLSLVLFAVAFHALRQRRDLTPALSRVLDVVFVIACVATVAMAVHLLSALGAASLANGEQTTVSRIQTINETVVDAAWGLAIAAVALVGGATRRIGNLLTLPFGVVGGLAFALASGTIPYTDTFDPLFKVGSLVAVWAILVGVSTIRRPA